MNKFLLGLALVSALLSNGQNSEPSTDRNDTTQPKVEKFLFKIKGFPTGLEAEFGITSKTTFMVSAETFFYYGENNDGDFEFGWFPFTDIQYRYYYNFEKRLTEGKNIANNSGNYIALKYLNYFLSTLPEWDDEDPSNINFLGPVWGLQRNYLDHWNIALELGLAAGWNSSGGFAPIPFISFNVGYNF